MENKESPRELLPEELTQPNATQIPLEDALPQEAFPVEEVVVEETPAPAEADTEVPSLVEVIIEESAPAEVIIKEPVPAEVVIEESAPAEVIIEEPVPAEVVIEESAPAEVVPEEPVPVEELPVPVQPEPVPQRMEPIPQEEELDLELLKETLLKDDAPAPQTVSPEDIRDQEYRDNGKDFDAMYNAPAPEPEPFPIHPPRKGRPKRKKGEGLLGIPNILVTFVWLALILVIGVTLGRMLWVCAADVLAFGREDKPVTLTVYEADTMEDIIDKLYDNGLIRYKSLFALYADISDAEEDIQPGIYDLNTRYDYHALVNFMSPRSSREVVEGVLIPEGYTCKQIFELLEENKVCTAQDIAAYAANGELGDYWFLEGVERGTENCLEGYLFPDTYDFYKNSSPKEVLTKLLNNFESKFDEDMQEKLQELNAELTGDYTVREIVIVASLIEKESAAPGESPNIAGVIYNRLFNWEYPAFLNIDAAIVYAQGGEAEHIDTKLDSPYNTYLNIGLTPGPIANPGLSSLKAALDPESHNYYYYVLNPSTGMHQFSTTEEEHNANVAAFYND